MELFLESMQLDITMSYGRNYYISRRDMLPYMDSLELRTPSYIMMIFVNNVQYYVRWLEINVEILLSNCLTYLCFILPCHKIYSRYF